MSLVQSTYLSMEVELSRDTNEPEFTRVTKRLRDTNDLPIGIVNDNPILVTWIYEVGYLDGHTTSLGANSITENMFTQVDDEGNRYTPLDSIADYLIDGKQILQQDVFLTSKNGGRRRRETTKG